MTSKRVIVTADDFGLCEAVNEAVERAHRDGVLTAASLMVAGPAAADAVRRARALPSLKVGLHLVMVEGPAVLGPPDIPLLAAPLPVIPAKAGIQARSHNDGNGAPDPGFRRDDGFVRVGHDALVGGAKSDSPAQGERSPGEGASFPSDQLGLALRYAFRPAARRQLAAEIRAQFAAFAATGLPLDHADAHKHMHLHPTVGRLVIDIGREWGLRAVRVPAEPPGVLARCGERPGLGARAMHGWTALLRRQVRQAGMLANDYSFGLRWSGHLTAPRLLRLLPHLRPGLSEIYCHPASRPDPILVELMPRYEHEAELAALLDPRVAAAFAASGAALTDWTEEASRCSR